MTKNEALMHAERVNIARQRFHDWHDKEHGKTDPNNRIAVSLQLTRWLTWLAALQLNNNTPKHDHRKD
jgi:hypothetical protein